MARPRLYTEEEARERKNARQREYNKKTNNAYDSKYKKEKTKTYTFRCMKETEEDLIDYIEQIDNKAGYIKQLIREDMERRKGENPDGKT